MFISLSIINVRCVRNTDSSIKKHKHYDNIVDVNLKLVDIKTEKFFGHSFLYIMNDFLIVVDVRASMDKGIHFYDKHSFKYIASTGIIGNGPGELTRTGAIGIDKNNNFLWVPDHEKMVIWRYSIDSLMIDEFYKPSYKKEMKSASFIITLSLLNDSIALGKGVFPISTSNFEMKTVVYDLFRNDISEFGYEHPETLGMKMSNSYFNLSIENNLYVNSFNKMDLVTICHLNGSLKCNVFGPGWNNKNKKNQAYFCGVDFIDDKIIASYLGGDEFYFKEQGRPWSNNPSKFIIFDLSGNYIKTIDTGSQFSTFCVDNDSKRVIVFFDDRDNPLAYFNYNEL